MKVPLIILAVLFQYWFWGILAKILWYVNIKNITILVLSYITQPYLPLRPHVQATFPPDASPPPPVATVERTFSMSDWSQQRSESFDALCLKSTSFPDFLCVSIREACMAVRLHEFFPTSPILIRIKILAAFHLFCLFCCLFLWVICCPLVIICPTVTDKKKITQEGEKWGRNWIRKQLDRQPYSDLGKWVCIKHYKSPGRHSANT